MRESVDGSDDVAIIGMAARLPCASTIEEFWSNLEAGRCAIRSWSIEELTARGVPPDVLSDARYVRAGVVVDGIELFDAEFFGMSATEAKVLDPQERLLLECAWTALEDAACPPASFDGVIGVYAGKSMSGYLMHNLASNLEALTQMGLDGLSDLRIATGNDKDYAASLISYKLGLKGPSVSVQTACSTSLVAVHVACQELLNDRCDLALAGGASLNLAADRGYLYREGGILSSDGYCRVFDAKASGTVRGSGAGMVVLRRMSDALAAGDRIYASIKGSAINNDGARKVGFVAPSVDGQRDVISQAMALARTSAESIGYVEAHGTATRLGDPIEVAALTEAYRRQTNKREFCFIGSVKGNVGHLDVAAGVVGLIKATLCLHHRRIVPQAVFEVENPLLELSNSPFKVPMASIEWRHEAESLRRAGVSSFGMGGTNAHIILEEAPNRKQGSRDQGIRVMQLLPISGRSLDAVKALENVVLRHVDGLDRMSIPALASLLQNGRTHFEFRRAVCAETGPSGSSKLIRVLGNPRIAINSPKVVFMFPGQGAQYAGMARGLLSEPAFRVEIDHCIQILKPQTKWNPEDYLLAGKQAGLDDIDVIQPVLFAVEYSLARLWMSWGVRPAALIGHSLGEYVAACIADVLTLDEALGLMIRRGQLMRTTQSGAMLAVGASEVEVSKLLPADLAIAADNSPSACVVAGDREQVERFGVALRKRSIASSLLPIPRAWHSRAMDPILEEFGRALQKVSFKLPSLPIVSNVTGDWMRPVEAIDPGRWVRHLREPVQFRRSVDLLLLDSDVVLLEVGPGSALQALVRQNDRCGERLVASSLPRFADDLADQSHMTRALAQLWQAGTEVDWRAYSGRRDFNGAPAPAYPFQRRRYWIDCLRGRHQTTADTNEPSCRDDFDLHAVTGEELQSRIREPITEALGKIWDELLGLRVKPESELGQLGVDSLLFLQFRARVEDELGVSIPIELLVADARTMDHVEHILGILAADHAETNSGPATTEKLN